MTPARLHRTAAAARRLQSVTLSAQSRFEHRPPSPQTAVDAVPGLWASRLPAPLAGVAAGDAPLFEDERIAWALDRIGGVRGDRVLELGPLEGGHTFMAHEAGAASIVAVEANREAFLKCLVIKELLGLDRAGFLCGDALEFLEATDETYDVCFAHGLLYHLGDPVRLLELVSSRAGRLVLWTHVHDEAVLADRGRSRRFAPPEPASHAGFAYTAHRHRYGVGQHLAGFWGGTRRFSTWLSRADLLGALAHFGWIDVEIAFEEVRGQGPALALVARRPDARR